MIRSQLKKPMKHKILKLLLSWHHRAGLLSAFFILFLAITGIMLNHSASLGLSERPLESKWLLKRYGIENPQALGVETIAGWVAQLDHSRIYLNTLDIGSCNSPLVGAVVHKKAVIAACQNALIMTTLSGELIEKISVAQGLPSLVSSIAVSQNGKLLLDTTHGAVTADLLAMKFAPRDQASAETIQWRTMTSLPVYLENQLAQLHKGSEISLERVILDIHSGRFFGSWGPWIIDIIAAVFTFLALSGCIVWTRRIRRSKRPRTR